MTISKLEEIKAMEAKLEHMRQEAAKEIAEGKKVVMAEILSHMQENKIQLSELSLFARTSSSKYSDGGGKNTWSGKGKKPAWVVTALAAGKKLEDLLTVKPAADA